MSWLLEKAGQGRDKLGHLASPDVKQAMLWARDALRGIPEEVVKNCWKRASILPFEVNPRYIEDKGKVMKGDVHLQKAADHLVDLFGKLSTVYSESQEEAVRQFDSTWLTEEGDGALDVLAPLVESDCERDDFEGFVKAVLDDMEAEQRVEEEDSDSESTSLLSFC